MGTAGARAEARVEETEEAEKASVGRTVARAAREVVVRAVGGTVDREVVAAARGTVAVARATVAAVRATVAAVRAVAARGTVAAVRAVAARAAARAAAAREGAAPRA